MTKGRARASAFQAEAFRASDGRSNDNVVFAFDVRGPVELGAFRRVFRALGQRHKALRTRFVADADDRVWAVQSQADADGIEVDLGALTPAHVTEWIVRTGEVAFDMGHGPLWRWAVLTVSPTSHVAVVIGHRSVIDSWSREPLLRELTALYAWACAAGKGGEAVSPVAPVAIKGRLRVRNGRDQAWREQWADTLRPSLPKLPMTDVAMAVRGHWKAFALPPIDARMVRRVAAIARERGSRIDEAMIAVVITALHGYLGGSVVVGAMQPYRSGASLDWGVGSTADCLPLLVSLDRDPTFSELIGSVERARASALIEAASLVEIRASLPAERQQVPPFGFGVTYVGAAEEAFGAVAFQVVSGVVMSVRDVGVTGMHRLIDGRPGAAVPLLVDLAATGRDGGLTGALWALSPGFDAATVRQLAFRIARTLEQCAGHSRWPVSRIAASISD